MAGEVLFVAEKLFDTICEAKERWGQRKQNVALSEELQGFVQDLQKNMQELEKKAAGTCSNSSVCALAALGKYLEMADAEAKDILHKGFIRSIWDAKKTLSKLRALRERVMTSLQIRIVLITLDVAIEGQKGMDAFGTAMLKVNEELKSNSPMVLRNDLRLALQPIMESMEYKKEKIHAATLVVGKMEAQTTEAEKFFADVLAGLEQISMVDKSETDGNLKEASYMDGSNDGQSIEWFEDPLTCKLMCDPVKAVDGHTYDRWTIVRHAGLDISTSPFSRTQAFAIATDDIDVRSRLFAKFPEQEVKFRAERATYREAALEAANKGHVGDAVGMLGHVLQWDPDDKECQERRQQALLEIEVGESILKAGQSLQAGAWLRKGSYKLIMQGDDNLVIYCEQDENGGSVNPFPTWSSKTYLKAGGNGECHLTMERDGKLVMYKGISEKEVVWESSTQWSSGSEGDYALHLKETGILEIRSRSGVRHWCSEPMSTLRAGESLRSGSFLLKGAYKLNMQQDDNLVLYHLQDGPGEHAVWASGTMGTAGGTGKCSLVMQRDCNLVILDGEGSAVWMSNSRKPVHLNYSLHLRSDGALDIRSPNGDIMRRYHPR